MSKHVSIAHKKASPPDAGKDSLGSLENLSSNMSDYSATQIADIYCIVLDHLLFPPDVKSQLIATQTMEKKWQTIQMQKHILKDTMLSRSQSWGEAQISLLVLIEKAKVPDIQHFIRLRSMLSTANLDILTGFLSAGGVELLLKCIDHRLVRVPMSDFDTALLYETMCCCKMVMNNGTGIWQRTKFVSPTIFVIYIALQIRDGRLYGCIWIN